MACHTVLNTIGNPLTLNRISIDIDESDSESFDRHSTLVCLLSLSVSLAMRESDRAPDADERNGPGDHASHTATGIRTSEE